MKAWNKGEQKRLLMKVLLLEWSCCKKRISWMHGVMLHMRSTTIHNPTHLSYMKMRKWNTEEKKPWQCHWWTYSHTTTTTATLTLVTTDKMATALRISCHAPMFRALDATGRLNWVVNFQASTLISRMLLNKARRGARGKEATNKVMKPNWTTENNRAGWELVIKKKTREWNIGRCDAGRQKENGNLWFVVRKYLYSVQSVISPV